MFLSFFCSHRHGRVPVGGAVLLAPCGYSTFPPTFFYIYLSVFAKNIAGIYFVSDIVEGCVVAVGYDGLRLFFKLGEVVHYFAAEEGGALFECGFVYYHFGSFGFYAFHYALYGGVTEVVAAAFHREAVDAYGALPLAGGVVVAVAVVVVVAGFFEYLVGYEVFAGDVALYYGFYEVLRHVVVVGQ